MPSTRRFSAFWRLRNKPIEAAADAAASSILLFSRLFQRKDELAVLTVFAAHRDGLAMGVDDGLGDVHSQSDAGFVHAATLVALVETVEDVGQILGSDPLPFVVDRNIDLLVLLGDADGVFPAIPGEFHAVIADVVEDLMDGVPIADDLHVFLVALEADVQLLALDPALEGDQDLPCHFADVEDLHIEFPLSRFDPGNVQQGGNQP